AVPSEFSASGGPITTGGTITIAEATQSANTVYAEPTSGGAAAPGYRALVAADIPALAVGGDLTGTLPNPTVASAAGAFAFKGDVTPTAIGGPVNDYTGCDGQVICDIDGGAGDRTISGFANGTDGRLLVIRNIGLTN